LTQPLQEILSRQDLSACDAGAKLAKKEFFTRFSEPSRPLRPFDHAQGMLCGRQGLSDLFRIQNFKYFWLGFSRLSNFGF
jgi:hypothetical protein